MRDCERSLPAGDATHEGLTEIDHCPDLAQGPALLAQVADQMRGKCLGCECAAHLGSHWSRPEFSSKISNSTEDSVRSACLPLPTVSARIPPACLMGKWRRRSLTEHGDSRPPGRGTRCRLRVAEESVSPDPDAQRGQVGLGATDRRELSAPAALIRKSCVARPLGPRPRPVKPADQRDYETDSALECHRYIPCGRLPMNGRGAEAPTGRLVGRLLRRKRDLSLASAKGCPS